MRTKKSYKSEGAISYFLLAIICISILLIGAEGCAMPSLGGGAKKTTGPVGLGLSVSFVNNTPQSQIVVNQQFKIYTDIKNLGGYDILPGKAKFFLGGTSGNFQGIATEKQNLNILGKKSATFEGGVERIIFAEDAKFISPLINSFSQKFILTSCYEYGATAETAICVGKGNQVCSLSGEKMTSASGSTSPIQVSSLTEQVIGNKLQVKFTIQNKGTGEVFTSDADCNKLQDERDINERQKQNLVKIAVTAEQGFSCGLLSEQLGSINAMAGLAPIGQITCLKDISSDTDHSTPIRIVLEYKYRESLSKNVTILPE